MGTVIAELDGHEDKRYCVRVLGPFWGQCSALAIRPANLEPVRGLIERQKVQCHATSPEATDSADEGVTVRYRLADRVTVNMTMGRAAHKYETSNTGSDSESESIATLLDQSGETVPAELTQGGIPASSRVSANFIGKNNRSLRAHGGS